MKWVIRDEGRNEVILGEYLAVTENRDGASVWYLDRYGQVNRKEYFNVRIVELDKAQSCEELPVG